VAMDLLHALDMEPDVCKTEEEAIAKMDALVQSRDNKVKKWPVYFFESDTSGEKPFEEFYTDGELLDVGTFVHLGVVKNAKRRPLAEVEIIFEKLRKLFQSDEVTKTKVVEVLSDYLPNFSHIETGKGLDQKM
jgi:hypothetical protein